MTPNRNSTGDDLNNRALKQALRRQAAPEGFAERFFLRLEQQQQILATTKSFRSDTAPYGSLLVFFTRPLVRWTAAAAVAAAMAVGVSEEIHYRRALRERAQGEAAKQRLMLALHIAGNKLQLARSKVNRTDGNRGGNSGHAQQIDN